MSEIRLGQTWRHKRKGYTVTITTVDARHGFITRRLPGEKFMRERRFLKRFELQEDE